MRARHVPAGETYGLLTVVEEAEKRNGKRRFLVRCICGKTLITEFANLVAGNTKSCGHTRGPSLRARQGYVTPGNQARNYIFLNYKSTAKQKGRDWDISFDEFCNLTQRNCVYCGSPPLNKTKDKNGPGSFVYNGLDRIDSSQGYTKNNVVTCCVVCNRAKNDMTLDEFYTWAGRLLSHRRN